MKTKNFFLIFPFALFSFLITSFIPQPLFAQHSASAESKLAELNARYRAENQLAGETLSAPLASSLPLAAPLNLPPESLLGAAYTPGHEGEIFYEQVSDTTFRLKYLDLETEAFFYFLFEKPQDLRNRWMRLRYSGLKTPHKLTIRLDHAAYRSDTDFAVYPEDTLKPAQLFFKLPDKATFENVKSLGFVIDPSEEAAGRDGDFMILGLDLIEDEAVQSALLPETDLMRFDWYRDPFQSDNRTPGSTAKQF